MIETELKWLKDEGIEIVDYYKDGSAWYVFGKNGTMFLCNYDSQEEAITAANGFLAGIKHCMNMFYNFK